MNTECQSLRFLTLLFWGTNIVCRLASGSGLWLHIFQNNEEFFDQHGLMNRGWNFSSPSILNALFLYPGRNLTFSMQIFYEDEAEDKAILFDETTRLHLTTTLASLGHSPHIVFQNSTFDIVVHQGHDPSMHVNSWVISVDHDAIVQGDGRAPAVLPTEEWTITMMLGGENTQLLSSSGTLIDMTREFVLLWNLGVPVGGPPADVLGSLQDIKVRIYPCAIDIAVLGVIHNSNNPGIYLARTSIHFWGPSIVWFDLACVLSQCRNNVCGTGCVQMKLVDIVLTNWYLLVLTDQGLYLSNSMAPTTGPNDRTLQFTKVNKFTSGDHVLSSLSFTGKKLHYTTECITTLDGILVEHVGLTMEPVAAGVTTIFACHGHDSFLEWHCLNATILPGVKLVKSMVINSHIHAVLVLAEQQSSVDRVHAFKMCANHGRYTPLHTAGHEFATGIDQIYIHPYTYVMYAIGNQVFMSHDNGNIFLKIYAPPDGSIVNKLFLSPRCDMIFMLTSTGSLLFGRAGVGRLSEVKDGIEVNQPVTLYMNHLHKFFILQLETSGDVKQTTINTIALLKEAKKRFTHPIAIQFLSDSHGILHEHKPFGQNVAKPAFERALYGMRFDLLKGGSGIVKDVNEDHPLPGFLARTDISILTPFVFDSVDLSPAQQHSIALDDENHHGEVIISIDSVFTPGTGWKQSDVGKTVVLPYGYSYLLSRFIDETTIGALCIVDYHHPAHLVYKPGFWHLYDLSNTQNDAKWELREDECRFKVTPGEKHRIKRQFQIDSHEEADFIIKIATFGLDPVPAKRPMVIASLSNPQQFYNIPTLYSFFNYQQLRIHVYDNQYKKGMSFLVFHMPVMSLMCANTVHVITLYSTCPFGRRIQYHYPIEISREDYLTGKPKDQYSRSLIMDLPVNYRPPSRYGILIPISEYIYNADPSKFRHGDFYSISRTSGHYHWCAGVKDRRECDCTDDMKLSSSVQYTDCKERVYRKILPATIKLNFSLREPATPIRQFASPYVVMLTELNNRSDLVYSAISNENLEAFNIMLGKSHNKYYGNPDAMIITLVGSGLYHFRVSILPGFSYCNMSDEFQIYVDSLTLPYPMQYLLNTSIAIIFGSIIFGVYQWYLIKHHHFRVKKSGPLCLDAKDFHYDPFFDNGCCQCPPGSKDADLTEGGFESTGLHIRHSAKPIVHETVELWLAQQHKLTSMTTLARLEEARRRFSSVDYRRRSVGMGAVNAHNYGSTSRHEKHVSPPL